MKPKSSTLGAMCALAGLAVGQSASIPSAPPKFLNQPPQAQPPQAQPSQPKAMPPLAGTSIIDQLMIMGRRSSGDIPASWRHLNQRQKRLARRRRHAQGDKKAFR